MENSDKPLRVLIVRLTALGDVVQALDAFRIVRREFSNVEWHWAVADMYRPLVEGEDGLTSILSVPRRWSLKKWLQFKKIHQTQYFDLIIDTQTLLKSFLVSLALSKSTIVAWGKQQSRDWLAPRLATYVVNTAPVSSRLATLALFREALDYCGKKRISIDPPHSSHALEDAQSFAISSPWGLAKLNPQPRIICSAGSGWPTKQIDVAAWSKLLQRVRQDFPDADIEFIAGSNAEVEWLEQYMPSWSNIGVTMAPKMDIKELKTYFKAGHLFLGMDSGPAHLAASCGCVTLLFYGPSLPEAYDRYGCSPRSARGQCHLKQHFERRCDYLRKCQTCSAITSIDVLEVWEQFKKSL